MPLSTARKGEIAIAVVKHHLRKNGLALSDDFKDELVQGEKDGVKWEEMAEFLGGLLQELVNETFKHSDIKITPRN